MFFIARTCSVVRAPSSGLPCAGVSVVSMGVWLPGESLDSAMVVATGFGPGLSESSCDLVLPSQALHRSGKLWLLYFFGLRYCVACKHKHLLALSSASGKSSSRDKYQHVNLTSLTAVRAFLLVGLLHSTMYLNVE